ncbi:uncharacterized protein FIBRA_09486 [Fibroporia radiculosa]|uniref:Uncharacterized protein n=1 Tax=Fibroporia radiculosa TaxID=599839 RepID=J7SD32_9APHY|nr:uncharacterized protein FIBRA_09486 [Fibroporia radiculosa]CCM07148.1 predicted protein [Fibroporia radiculosa]
MAGPQRAPTPHPSHLQTLEECFTAGIIEMPVPIWPVLSFPSQQESDESSLEFLDEGGFHYPFTSLLPNVTRRPFLIPGPPDSSNSDAVVLHQFPGPLEVPHRSEASSRSYHVAPAQVFPSSSPMNISSSSNPDSPAAASTHSPSMPPLASNASDNGSLDHAPNLQLLANVSEYITVSEGHSSNPQEFVVYSNNIIQRPSNDVTRYWRSIPFDTSTPVQDVNPLERVLPYFPGAYATTVTRLPMGVPIDGNPAFGLQWVLTTVADVLHAAEPVGNWNSSDKEWEEDTWEYLLTRDDNLLESLWALLQDIKDPGVTDEVDCFRAVDAKIDLLLATQQSIGVELIRAQGEIDQCRTQLQAANLEECLEQHKFSIITPPSGTMPHCLHFCTKCEVNGHLQNSYILIINSTPPPTSNLDNFPVPLTNLGIYRSIAHNGNCEQQIWRGG